MNYPGGKNGSGVYQQIINKIPPHDTYIEAFLGSGAIMRKKRPSAKNIGIEKDLAVIGKFDDWRRCRSLTDKSDDATGFTIINDDAILWLNEYHYSGREFVYCDPPYVLSSRKGDKIYRHELSNADHKRLLDVLLNLPCMVMVSGYYSDLYAEKLSKWQLHTFRAMTRHGPATEHIWMNYDPPIALHDYKFIGDNFRDRERIKRKSKRWSERLKSLPRLERLAILSDILSSQTAMQDLKPVK